MAVDLLLDLLLEVVSYFELARYYCKVKRSTLNSTDRTRVLNLK
jgi:hypothetical protein